MAYTVPADCATLVYRVFVVFTAMNSLDIMITDDEARFMPPIAIMDGQILNGILPSSLHKKVVIWLDHHREEAIQAWESIREGRLPNWIE
jgi:hypothetical protein